MARTLLARLFGVGKLPPALMAALEQEGVLLLDEGVPGSATYRNFRAPGRSSGWRRTWFTGSVAVTQVRLLALAYGRPIVDVPLADQRLGDLRLTVEDGARLCIGFDAALFHPGWSGTIDYRLRVAEPQRYVDLVEGCRSGATGGA